MGGRQPLWGTGVTSAIDPILSPIAFSERTADSRPGPPLFGEGGLGLDSIDVLELAMALHKRYGVKTKGDDERNREIFASVKNLAAFVAAERAGGTT